MKIIFWYDDKYKGMTELARCPKRDFKHYAVDIMEQFIDSEETVYYNVLNGDKLELHKLDYYNTEV